MRPRLPDPICETCGQSYRPKSRKALGKTRFCSRPCYWKWRSTDETIRHHMATISKAGAIAANSPEHRHKKIHYGSDNPAWRGGVTYWRKHGNYPPIKYIRCPDDLLTMARKDNYVMEHRVIMARMAGRPLLRTEVVHHLNHNPQDNTPVNLELWPSNASHKAAEHGRIAPGAACQLSPKA